eukprot:542449_1
MYVSDCCDRKMSSSSRHLREYCSLLIDHVQTFCTCCHLLTLFKFLFQNQWLTMVATKLDVRSRTNTFIAHRLIEINCASSSSALLRSLCSILHVSGVPSFSTLNDLNGQILVQIQESFPSHSHRCG